MEREDLKLFFESRAINKTAFADEVGIPISTLKYYLMNGRISKDNAIRLDRVMQTHYNYNYRTQKINAAPPKPD